MLYKESDIDRSNKNFAVTIKKHIEENYSDRRISMNTLIGLVGYSDVRINSVFKKDYGMTPIEYLQKIRIEKVKELISIGVPIGMAAYKAGYGSQRTFYRVFQKQTGMSPGEYKQNVFGDYSTALDMVKQHELSPLEYARKICDTIMYECDPTKLPPVFVDLPQSRYTYQQGIFLLGMYYIYQWCDDKRYLNYISEWIDTVIDENGCRKETVEHPIVTDRNNLDAFQPLRLMMSVSDAIENVGIKKTIERDFERYKHLKKNRSGAFLHGSESAEDGVLLNSVYMLGPTLCMYAKKNNENILYRVAADQAIIMYQNMRNEETGLLYHAWDDTMREPWADPEDGLLKEVWGRGMAYYCMGILDMLDYIPETNKIRKKLKNIIKDVLIAVAQYQDKSGRWYQLLEKDTLEDNWLENSCTCMFAYSFAKAINLGIFGKEYARIAIRAYCGIIDDIEYDNDGEIAYIKNICEGISVGAREKYIENRRSTNDLHGMGAFVHMCIEMEKLLKILQDKAEQGGREE